MLSPSRLDNPPITEVVCGVFFAAVPEIDPVVLGEWWQTLRTDFPRRELKAVIAPIDAELLGFQISQDLGPVRTWFVSKDDVLIIQVQQDRFYVNWRMRGADYPRFSDWDGEMGLLSRFLQFHGSFDDFCQRTLGARLSLTGLELTKIDQLLQPKHFDGPADLARLAPMLASVLGGGQLPQLSMNVSRPLPDGSMDVAWNSMLTPGTRETRGLRLDCRRVVRRNISPEELREAFALANREVNDQFCQIIPPAEHHRFMNGSLKQ